MSLSGIELKNICFSYLNSLDSANAREIVIFKDFNVKIPGSKVSVILGPSGCGKSTLLNIIHGILTPDSGVVEKWNSNTISFLFQEPRLLSWKTVIQNIELILRNHFNYPERQKISRHYLELVGLKDFSDYYPSELSGGMRQRVAIARAFAYPAEIILMDEPFQALDMGLKLNLTQLFSRLWTEDNRTAVFVTHDITEAIILGDDIFVMSHKKPSTLIEHISNPVPQGKRHPENPECLNIEARLYTLLTDY